MYLALSTKEGVRWSCPSKILKFAFFEFGAILFATGQILPLTLARLPIGKGRNMKDVVRLYPISKPKQKRRSAMKVSQATKSFLDYHRMNSKKKYAQELRPPSHRVFCPIR